MRWDNARIGLLLPAEESTTIPLNSNTFAIDHIFGSATHKTCEMQVFLLEKGNRRSTIHTTIFHFHMGYGLFSQTKRYKGEKKKFGHSSKERCCCLSTRKDFLSIFPLTSTIEINDCTTRKHFIYGSLPCVVRIPYVKMQLYLQSLVRLEK